MVIPAPSMLPPRIRLWGMSLLAFGGFYAVVYPMINEHIIALMTGFLILGLGQSYWLKKEK